MLGHDEVVKPLYGIHLSCARREQYETNTKRINKALVLGERVDFWDPGLLVRGALDYKIDLPAKVSDAPNLISETIAMAVDLHRATVSAERFAIFVDDLKNHPGLLRSTIVQPHDRITEESSNPLLCKDVSRALRRKTGGKEALFVVLGHGGITAGILTYLYYSRTRKAADSIIYPVRFSRDKKKDTHPRLEPAEVEHLKALASNTSRVIVFDEDTSRGDTLMQASNVLNILLDVDVIPAANQDAFNEKLVGARALKTYYQDRHRTY